MKSNSTRLSTSSPSSRKTWSEFLAKLIGARIVEAEKITGYLLDTGHPTGGAKARFFARFGFTSTAPSLLADALRAHPEANEIVKITRTAYGIRSVIECHLASPDGRDPCIRSVWLCDHGSALQRLVTAYPIAPV